MTIREIKPSDNAAIAQIIRAVLTALGADPETTVLGETSLNTMYENYQEDRAVYFIAEEENIILGGAGIRKLIGSVENICELQRMFLAPEARGKGIGKKLMELCLQKAKEFSYKTIYLETFSQSAAAISLYEKTGFHPIPKALGNTGHSGCNIFMILDTDEISL